MNVGLPECPPKILRWMNHTVFDDTVLTEAFIYCRMAWEEHCIRWPWNDLHIFIQGTGGGLMKTTKTAHNISIPAEICMGTPRNKAKSVITYISLLVNKVSCCKCMLQLLVNMWRGRIYSLRRSKNQFQDLVNVRWSGCHLLKTFCVWVSSVVLLVKLFHFYVCNNIWTLDCVINVSFFYVATSVGWRDPYCLPVLLTLQRRRREVVCFELWNVMRNIGLKLVSTVGLDVSSHQLSADRTSGSCTDVLPYR
jgi:hypothetical protein